ncbi:MAG: hypothetical protein QOJ89_4345 [bacterium]|jgi:hypothetical protein
MEGHLEAGQAAAGASDAIAPVMARMEEIAAPLEANDGVRRFNELYYAVTVEVAKQTGAGTFEDPHFIARLDVVFAGLYFKAVDAAAGGGTISKAWEPLFQERHKTGVAPLQFATAGMNAHINNDLAIALVATCKELGVDLAEDTPQHRDYNVVNGILVKVQEAIKPSFATGVVAEIDKTFGTADDMFASWSVEAARDAAWAAAQLLAAVDDNDFLRNVFLKDLARRTGFTSRLLLSRTS